MIWCPASPVQRGECSEKFPSSVRTCPGSIEHEALDHGRGGKPAGAGGGDAVHVFHETEVASALSVFSAGLIAGCRRLDGPVQCCIPGVVPAPIGGVVTAARQSARRRHGQELFVSPISARVGSSGISISRFATVRSAPGDGPHGRLSGSDFSRPDLTRLLPNIHSGAH